MDVESQKRKIRRFLKGSIKDGIDAFCIYQWIERCHYQGWWEMGVVLGSHIQPNSLNKDYQKRLEFILSECRRNNDLEKKAKDTTIREIMESLDAAEKDAALQLLEKLGIDLDTKSIWIRSGRMLNESYREGHLQVNPFLIIILRARQSEVLPCLVRLIWPIPIRRHFSRSYKSFLNKTQKKRIEFCRFRVGKENIFLMTRMS